jgi:hypothetical protein
MGSDRIRTAAQPREQIEIGIDAPDSRITGAVMCGIDVAADGEVGQVVVISRDEP